MSKVELDIKKILFFRNLKKTFKLYFKDLFYILLINAFYLFVLVDPLKIALSNLLLNSSFLSTSIVKILVIIIPLFLILCAKIVIYAFTIDNFQNKIPNDIFIIFQHLVIRYFPVFATLITIIVFSAFLSLIFVIPGIIVFIYSLSALTLSSLRDYSDGHLGGGTILKGPRAIARSFALIKGNFWRVTIFYISAIVIVFILVVFFNLIATDFVKLNQSYLRFIELLIFDLLIIFNVVVTLRLEKLESENIADKFKVGDKSVFFKR